MIPEKLMGSIGKSFDELVKDVLAYSRSKHTPINSIHEGLAVIWEEFEEMKAEVFKKKPVSQDILIELASVAAMCQRMAEDCALAPGGNELLVHACEEHGRDLSPVTRTDVNYLGNATTYLVCHMCEKPLKLKKMRV